MCYLTVTHMHTTQPHAHTGKYTACIYEPYMYVSYL